MLDLDSSIRNWGATRRRWITFFFVATVVPIALWIGWHLGDVFQQPDAGYYMNLAVGKPAMAPFASRQLGPLIVRGLMHLSHVSIYRGFMVEGVASLVFFVGSICFLLVRSGAPRWMMAAAGGLFFWSLQFSELMMPDLFYAALMCCFLLLLRRQHLLAAALTMFPLMVSRESTLLALVCFLAAGWRRLRIHEAVTAVASTVAGMLVVKHLSANALPNEEQISPTLYLFAKLPWNFLKNVLGIEPWANVYPLSCSVPKWQIALHVGPLHAIGFCQFLAQGPRECLIYATTTFGLLPLMLIRLRKVRTTTGGREDMLMRFAVFYGGLCFVMAPVLGAALIRLFGYSWPLFLVAVPLLLGGTRAAFSSKWAAWLFLAIHLSLSWSFVWLRQNPQQVMVAGVLLSGCGWFLLRSTWRVEDGAAPETASAKHPLKVL